LNRSDLTVPNSASVRAFASRSEPAKYQSVLEAARQLYETQPDWVTFFREILGVDGVVRRQFARIEDLTAFEKSSEFGNIQKWLVKLRERTSATDAESEPTRVITVRLPKSMHEYLRSEAHDLRTSMNKLCISKLLQVIEQDMIPRGDEGTGRRDREDFRRDEELRRREELRRQLFELQTRLSDYDNYLMQGASR
jgi:predicted HicB family RNase H-like nuclease